MEATLQEARIKAFKAFVADVGAGGYPEAKHEIHMVQQERTQFVKAAKQS
jgi:ketopantoate hydroxymethyltransferase